MDVQDIYRRSFELEPIYGTDTMNQLRQQVNLSGLTHITRSDFFARFGFSNPIVNSIFSKRKNLLIGYRLHMAGLKYIAISVMESKTIDSLFDLMNFITRIDPDRASYLWETVDNLFYGFDFTENSEPDIFDQFITESYSRCKNDSLGISNVTKFLSEEGYQVYVDPSKLILRESLETFFVKYAPHILAYKRHENATLILFQMSPSGCPVLLVTTEEK